MVKNHKQTHVFIQDGIYLANGASMFLLDINHIFYLFDQHSPPFNVFGGLMCVLRTYWSGSDMG